MLPFKIKICGLTSPADAIQAFELGADAIGINFFPKSARFVTNDQAQLITAAIDERVAELDRGAVKKIGVFVNKTAQEIVRDCFSSGLNGIQFHGDESPEIIDEVRSAMGSAGPSAAWQASEVVFVRAIRIRKEEGEAEIERVRREMASWIEAGVQAILLDAAVPGEFGGTGEQLDWRAVPFVAEGLPKHVLVVLAGGLNSENIVHAIKDSKVHSVDVASGVEAAPGIKDIAKMKSFIENAKRGFANSTK